MLRIKQLAEALGKLSVLATAAGIAGGMALLKEKDLREAVRRGLIEYMELRDKVCSWSANAAEEWRRLYSEAEQEYRSRAEQAAEEPPAEGPPAPEPPPGEPLGEPEAPPPPGETGWTTGP